MHALPRAGFLAIVTAALTACSSGLVGSPKTQPGEVDQLKRRVVELQQRATVAELEGDRLKREIARLEAELEKARQVSRVPPLGAPAESPPQAEAEPTDPATIGLGQEIEETDLEEPPHAVAEPAAEAPVAEPTAEAPVAEPQAVPPDVAEPVITTTEPSPPQPGSAAEEATTVPSAEAQALYDEGYALFNQQRYADAEARFESYVKLHPRTDLADNALFWIGECRYARGDFSSALAAFSSTVERYPHSNKVADALFKAGRCLESLGDGQQARGTYGEVIDRYPGSAAAARARERLDGLH